MVGRKILDVPGTLKSYKVPELSSFLSINPRKYTAGFSLAPLQKKTKKWWWGLEIAPFRVEGNHSETSLLQESNLLPLWELPAPRTEGGA